MNKEQLIQDLQKMPDGAEVIMECGGHFEPVEKVLEGTLVLDPDEAGQLQSLTVFTKPEEEAFYQGVPDREFRPGVCVLKP